VLRTETSAYHYKGKRRAQAGPIKRIKEIAEIRVRYGYRRVHVLLRREGWGVNAKRIYRLYKELGLQLRNKTPKRRVKAWLKCVVPEWTSRSIRSMRAKSPPLFGNTSTNPG
jgi:putative transposase